MDKYNFERLQKLGYLNEDDKKILKHLTAIDNIFKKGNPQISNIFAFSSLMACVMIDGEEYEFDSFTHIPCDGGDPNDEDLHQVSELDRKLDELDPDND